METIYCKRCLMPNTRPRVVFDDAGVCNACHNADMRAATDWDARRLEFLELIESYRSHDGSYDCIVPWSGGKDSSSIALRLKEEFGLNPLLVTFSPLVPTEVGVHNRETMLNYGFDHLMARPNQRVSRHLARRFFLERGNPKVAWDAGINATPIQVAVNYNIPLVFYAEHGESEYGGRVLSEEHRKIRDLAEVLEHQIGDDPMNWIDESVEEHDLAPYTYPDVGAVADAKVTAMYFAYFFPWNVYQNYRYVADRVDFKLAPNDRTDGTFNGYDSVDDKIDNIYYYMQFIKFGFGRAVRDGSRMIQQEGWTREHALEQARAFDGEFPSTYFAEALEFLGLSENEFTEIIDQHRNEEIWTFEGNQWRLRTPLT